MTVSLFGAGSKGQGRSGPTEGQQRAARRAEAAKTAQRGGSAVRQPRKAAPVQVHTPNASKTVNLRSK